MANHGSRLGEIGQRICEYGLDIQEACADGILTAAERRRVQRIGQQLAQSEAPAIEDFDLDIEWAMQTIRNGRRRTPSRPLRRKIATLDQARVRLGCCDACGEEAA